GSGGAAYAEVVSAASSTSANTILTWSRMQGLHQSVVVTDEVEPGHEIASAGSFVRFVDDLLPRLLDQVVRNLLEVASRLVLLCLADRSRPDEIFEQRDMHIRVDQVVPEAMNVYFVDVLDPDVQVVLVFLGQSPRCAGRRRIEALEENEWIELVVAVQVAEAAGLVSKHALRTDETLVHLGVELELLRHVGDH